MRTGPADRQFVDLHPGIGGDVGERFDQRRLRVRAEPASLVHGGGDHTSAKHAARPDSGTTIASRREQLIPGVRIEQAGGKLISKTQLYCELQRDWNRADTVPGFMNVFQNWDGSNPEKDFKE